MTYEELCEIAQRKGYVQWYPSKAVERLRIVFKPKEHFQRCNVSITAQAPIGDPKEHPIYPTYRDGTPRVFYCREVHRQETIAIGNLLAFRS